MRKQVFQQSLIAALPPVIASKQTLQEPLLHLYQWERRRTNNVEQQTQILEATLEQLVKIPSAGKIVPLPFQYIAHV